MSDVGKMLVVMGLLMAAVGALLWAGFGRGWLGRLPGISIIRSDNASFHFPIVTCNFDQRGLELVDVVVPEILAAKEHKERMGSAGDPSYWHNRSHRRE